MKRGRLRRYIQTAMKAIREENTTGAGRASFSPGAGAQIATPRAFKKDKKNTGNN